MKIGSSDISMTSNSRYMNVERKGAQALNSSGKALNGTGVNRVESREISAKARYVTSEGETSSMAREKGSRTEKTAFAETGADTEKLGYLASVYDWAADAIDQIVAGFEEREMAKRGRPVADAAASGVQERMPDTGSVSVDFQILLFQEMAEAFRSKARVLDPTEVRYYSQRLEMENTKVQAGGVVRTADGREINFTLDVQMDRSVMEETSKKIVRVVDPLVIDLTGSGIGFSGEKMAFDLDGDGVREEVGIPGEGSGFLALDLNQDGRINSGMELFGPATGNGFQELALYDTDQNMWIDENDEIYEKLRVWVQDGSGDGVLKKLSEAGIGAIHLGSVASEFSMDDDLGEAAGQVRSTGVALTEAGEARAVQQIDLVI